MSDWRQSRPEDFALTEKRGYASRDPDPPRQQGPDWRRVLLVGMLLGAVPTLALTWFVMSPSSDAGLQARLLDQARLVDALNEKLQAQATDAKSLQEHLDEYGKLEAHIVAVCAGSWSSTVLNTPVDQITSKLKFCQSFPDRFPDIFSP